MHSKFFKSSKDKIAKWAFKKTTAKIHTESYSFEIKGNKQGTLMKLHYNDVSKDWLYNNVFKKNPDCLITFTTPTIRLNSKYEMIFPGHNFALVTNQNGEVDTCMSKRPNTKKILDSKKRASDPRLSEKYAPFIPIYESYFSSYTEEFIHWIKRASLCKSYPMFIHIIPFSSGLITAKSFKQNVEQIILFDDSYRLHPTINEGGQLFVAANCNDNTYKTIFWSYKPILSEMCCQESIMHTMIPFVKNTNEYEEVAKESGLTKDIEPVTRKEEDYYALVI
ncbi:MAG: hypothetical protein HYX60_07215 [Legionella longbeachae]|nr:hypothetical protein [Legionella longbeachae]